MRSKQVDFLNAVGKGDEQVVKQLLAEGVIDRTDYDIYALAEASKNGHIEIVKLLLDDKRVLNLESFSSDCSQSINDAMTYGHDDIVSFLLSDKRICADAKKEGMDRIIQSSFSDLYPTIIASQKFEQVKGKHKKAGCARLKPFNLGIIYQDLY